MFSIIIKNNKICNCVTTRRVEGEYNRVNVKDSNFVSTNWKAWCEERDGREKKQVTNVRIVNIYKIISLYNIASRPILLTPLSCAKPVAFKILTVSHFRSSLLTAAATVSEQFLAQDVNEFLCIITTSYTLAIYISKRAKKEAAAQKDKLWTCINFMQANEWGILYCITPGISIDYSLQLIKPFNRGMKFLLPTRFSIAHGHWHHNSSAIANHNLNVRKKRTSIIEP